MAFLYQYAAPISICEGVADILSEAAEGKIQPKRKEKGKGKFSRYRARKSKEK